MIHEYKPTDKNIIYIGKKVFLAGSIEMGAAVDWQSKLVKEFDTEEWNNRVSFFNPRRDDWDSSWKQTINDPQFSHQVNWELDWLERADIIFLYLDPKTKSPISLLELGLHVEHSMMIVCCPDGFYRKGNVDIVCDRHGVIVYDTLEEAIEKLKSSI